MQRAEYLAQLYESVASIPPDIQECLLQIAQFGCEPEQVKRWYTLVRHHHGVGEIESPSGGFPGDPMPPPRLSQIGITQGLPTGPASPASTQPSSASYGGMSGSEMMRSDSVGIHPGYSYAPQDPWMTPAVSDCGFDSGPASALSGPHSGGGATIGGYPGFPPAFDGGDMAMFTGLGLTNVGGGGGGSGFAGGNVPFTMPYDFTMSSVGMPVYVKTEGGPSPATSSAPTLIPQSAGSAAAGTPRHQDFPETPVRPPPKKFRPDTAMQNVPRVTAPRPRPPGRPHMPRPKPPQPYGDGSQLVHTPFVDRSTFSQSPDVGSTSTTTPSGMLGQDTQQLRAPEQPRPQPQPFSQRPRQYSVHQTSDQSQQHQTSLGHFPRHNSAPQPNAFATPEVPQTVLQSPYQQSIRQQAQVQSFTTPEAPPPQSPYSQANQQTNQYGLLVAGPEPPPYKSPYA